MRYHPEDKFHPKQDFTNFSETIANLADSTDVIRGLVKTGSLAELYKSMLSVNPARFFAD